MRRKTKSALTCAVLLHLMIPYSTVYAHEGTHQEGAYTTRDIQVETDAAKEEAKYESQSTTIITAEDIAKKQAKSVEDIIFDETGMTRNIDAMGRVTVSIRGAEPRHTLILIDGQPVMGDLAKYTGAGDELQRLGTENVARIEIIRGAASAKYGADAIGGVVNVITKEAAKKPGLQLNLEGRRTKGDSDVFPYTNFFLRADAGQVGKLRLAAYGGKRDIMPIYSTETFGGIIKSGASFKDEESRIRNSLRYYGGIKNIGLVASYDLNKNHSLSLSLDHTGEDMERYVKRSNAGGEALQHFKRELDRDNYRLSYEGRSKRSDWNVSLDYAKMNEDDITLTSDYINSPYEGKNTLNYIDDLMHQQWSFKASANTQLSSAHLLSYGIGYTQEKGEGSRIKNAPNSYTRMIDPWDYDKNLYTKGGAGAPSSRVHDYAMTRNEAGVPKYDNEYEWYGHKDAAGRSLAPPYTYQDYLKYGPYGVDLDGNPAPPDVMERLMAFRKQLVDDPRNHDLTHIIDAPELAINNYYDQRFADYDRKMYGHAVLWNGKAFNEEFEARQNRLTIGSVEIKKQYVFLQDAWQVNRNTLLSPILRIDHSSLFGTHATFNIGMTHNIGGKSNQRFKANLGTGYTEPGMGELYYNWEMYAGAPMGLERARLGYYWVGNPNLKPEKSVNFDIGLEGESKDGRDSYRINAFHNRIRNYMTTYFTGYLMDFHPEISADGRWLLPPDMIYSFKNIGRAEITGLEAEYNHRFDRHWSTKVGYTYLHAINKSDPMMPDRLLNRPQHKLDLGVTYENAGWRATLWGNYYVKMLDSNSVANNGNYYDSDGVTGKWHYNFAEGGKQTYETKTFGIWNFILQKNLGKDSSAYIGVDNILNHRDDDRAFQERMYRIGVNMKFGPDADTVPMTAEERAARTAANEATLEKNARFIIPPFDMEKEPGLRVIGDYRWRWNSFTGKEKPSEARVTTVASVGDSAYKNYLEKAWHGFEQRLRAGVDARLDENTNITVLGSLAGTSGVDTETDAVQSKGLNHARLDTADVTRHAKEWDFSLGRLTEPMGVTGYYFGKEYDGGRAVWTGAHTQVRLGYGDFRHSTGVTDSAYTHATRQSFVRGVTKEEWLGYKAAAINSRTTDAIPYYPNYSTLIKDTPGFDGLYQRLAKAQSLAEEKQILDEYLNVVKQDNPQAYQELMNPMQGQIVHDDFAWYKVTVKDQHGNVVGTYLSQKSPQLDALHVYESFSYQDRFDRAKMEGAARGVWNSAEANLEATQTETNKYKSDMVGLPDGYYTMTHEFYGYGTYHGKKPIFDYNLKMSDLQPGDFKPMTKDEAKERTIRSSWDKSPYHVVQSERRYPDSPDVSFTAKGKIPAGNKRGISHLGQTIINYLIDDSNWRPEDASALPLKLLKRAGYFVLQVGTVIERDRIPAIKQAAYMQVRHEVTPNLGIGAFYLRSLGGNTHTFRAANGTGNDVDTFDTLANVVGVGARYRLTKNAALSFDYGANFTDFGRYMNGHTRYEHKAGTSDFAIKGRERGTTPTFWVMRLDIGQADMDVAGSWNAFIDWKRFEHGSFFGGNGTESLPDRYLDGIKSFTIGAGYVPVQNLMVEAFYTFGAKGTNTRDTLYGAEKFRLGDYARLQVTYRF